jgi:hypothetical protein
MLEFAAVGTDRAGIFFHDIGSVATKRNSILAYGASKKPATTAAGV